MKKLFSVIALAMGMVMLMSSGAAAESDGDGDKKHTICHATHSETNPFVSITVTKSAVVNAHIEHQDDEDIIPPFTYKGVSYQQNWDAAGQAVLANGCVVPEITITTPPPTTVPPTTTPPVTAVPPTTQPPVVTTPPVTEAPVITPPDGKSPTSVVRTPVVEEAPSTSGPTVRTITPQPVESSGQLAETGPGDYLWVLALIGLGLLTSGIILQRRMS